jgi:lysozyme family protein
MAAGNFAACLAIVLEMEGGYVDNPEDNGGPTNLGVTLATLQKWFGANTVATVQNVRDLTPTTVAPIYQVFWGADHDELLPIGIDLCVFDFSVNAGPGEGGRALQQALGVPVDGLVGPITINAAIAAQPLDLINKLAAIRTTYYEGLANFPTFGKGWLARVATITAKAKVMLA